jgi:hypothetical protein
METIDITTGIAESVPFGNDLLFPGLKRPSPMPVIAKRLTWLIPLALHIDAIPCISYFS